MCNQYLNNPSPISILRPFTNACFALSYLTKSCFVALLEKTRPSIHSVSPSLAERRSPRTRSKTTEHWHDVISQARSSHIVSASSPRTPANSQHGHGDGVHSDPFVILTPMRVNSRQLPRIGSPVHLGSTLGSRGGQHRIYRPPTPPRPAHKRPRLFGPDIETHHTSEALVDRSSNHVELHRRPEGMYAWSIGTGESCSRQASSISLPSAEWQLADLPNHSNAQVNAQESGQLTWREKLKTLSVSMKNMMKAFKQYGAMC
ncbi:hypothetical protein B0H11DRAFT_149316 [Mycena galericulata]|nr:hypothetical protein B0H11DRAFT_149316 [Mycena galericulata]